MDPSAYFAFGTELLKAFNNAQANKPPDQIRAEAVIAWGVAKPILKLILPADIQAALTKAGVSLG